MIIVKIIKIPPTEDNAVRFLGYGLPTPKVYFRVNRWIKKIIRQLFDRTNLQFSDFNTVFNIVLFGYLLTDGIGFPPNVTIIHQYEIKIHKNTTKV